MAKYKIRVGITMGDPSGIGPAITLKALKKLKGFAKFVVIGDRWVFDKNPKSLPACRQGRPNPNFTFIDLNNIDRKNFTFGKIKAEYGRASIEYLDKALELIRFGEIDCLVTCPISKESIRLAGFKWPGHTEYLAKRTHTKDFAMMLLNKDLKIVLITRHIPLSNVSSRLSRDNIHKTIILTHKALRELFLIKKPRIVVCGLNPHASDNGRFGCEENKIIKPAIGGLTKKKIYVDGPLSADVAILKAAQKKYDCVVSMYHDQALIPLKLCANFTGVNMTLGLTFIRTSPLHGTAFDIAGFHNKACPRSLIEAIKLAVKCTLNLKKA